MRDALIISVIFHIVIMASGMVGLPMLRPDVTPEMRIIPVEMVKISDVTRLKSQEKKPDPIKKKTVKKPQVRKVEMPPEPPKLASSMPLPDMKVKPRKKPQKKIQKEPVKTASRTPKVTPKTKPRRFNSGKLAALLDKREESEPDIIEKLKDRDFGRQKIISAIDLRQQTLSIIDSVNKHIYDNQCWNIPAGAKGAEGLAVTVKFILSPDGKLAGVPKIVDNRRMNLPGQEYFRTAAESVLRAVRKCAPYDFLPKAQYDLWREITIIFNPEQMLNG